MNLIARCPACQTSYRVVPDQLRISDGWVRCGQCGEIFDASQQLTEAAAEQAVAEELGPAGESVQEHLSFSDQFQPDGPQSALLAPSEIKQQSSSMPISGSSVRQQALNALSASEPSWASAALLVKPSSESQPDAEDAPEPVSLPSVATVSFMRAPDNSMDSVRVGRPVFWWALGVLLLFSLLLQGVYRERDQLAASYPAVKSALVLICETLTCRISPLQHIDELAIDAATFYQVGQDSFELRFVVKNKSRFEIALPAIELTLTDLADQPVMRRVFTPADLGVAVQTVASAGEWSATAYLRMQADATDARPQGYRLLIFYP